MPDTINPLDMLKNVLPLNQTQISQVETRNDEELQKACRDFESIFVNYMMQQMRQTVNKSGLLGASRAEEIYTSMLDSEVSKQVSQEGGIGLAAMIYNQMSTISNGQETKK